MATVRTQLLPISFCTSRTSGSFPGRSTWIASKRSGISPSGNSTSTTPPRICTTRPVAFAMIFLQLFSGKRFRAAHNIQNIVRDRLLANLVVRQLQSANQLLGVIGGVTHGDHACSMFTRLRFQNGLVDL